MPERKYNSAADPCGDGYQLTYTDLNIWLESVINRKNRTYITPDNGLHVFQGSSVRKADELFSKNIQNPKNIWTNNAPCPACLKYFRKYKKNVNLYVSHIDGSPDELHCLAKLVKTSKISLFSMDWGKFSKKLSKSSVCPHLIEHYLSLPEFQKAQECLEWQIKDIKNMSGSQCKYYA